MLNAITVHPLGSNDQFSIDVRGHLVVVDQPMRDGGEDTGPTPTELFVAGLASCVAFYARRYLRRHGIDEHGLEVTTEYGIGASPTRVADIRIRVTPPPALPAERRAAFLAVAEHCTVHNTLNQPPPVSIELESGARPTPAFAAS